MQYWAMRVEYETATCLTTITTPSRVPDLPWVILGRRLYGGNIEPVARQAISEATSKRQAARERTIRGPFHEPIVEGKIIAAFETRIEYRSVLLRRGTSCAVLVFHLQALSSRAVKITNATSALRLFPPGRASGTIDVPMMIWPLSISG